MNSFASISFQTDAFLVAKEQRMSNSINVSLRKSTRIILNALTIANLNSTLVNLPLAISGIESIASAITSAISSLAIHPLLSPCFSLIFRLPLPDLPPSSHIVAHGVNFSSHQPAITLSRCREATERRCILSICHYSFRFPPAAHKADSSNRQQIQRIGVAGHGVFLVAHILHPIPSGGAALLATCAPVPGECARRARAWTPGRPPA